MVGYVSNSAVRKFSARRATAAEGEDGSDTADLRGDVDARSPSPGGRRQRYTGKAALREALSASGNAKFLRAGRALAVTCEERDGDGIMGGLRHRRPKA
jgi:hypothetical protein